jgi:hypothetical protein
MVLYVRLQSSGLKQSKTKEPQAKAWKAYLEVLKLVLLQGKYSLSTRVAKLTYFRQG